MKKSIILMLAVLLSVFEMKAGYTWSEPADSKYSTHAVIYAALQNSAGERVGSVGNARLGAFIDGECRAMATEQSQVVVTNNETVYIFTLRVGVEAEDAGKSVTFALQCGENEYTLQAAKTVTVSGNDETVGGIPSEPLLITYTPITSISLPERMDVNMGETVNLLDKLAVEPKDATLPDSVFWDFANSSYYFDIENSVLTPKQPNIQGCYLGGNINTGAGYVNFYSDVYIHQPITGLALSPDFPDGLEVNIGDTESFNANLVEAVVVTPSDATEEITWKPSDAEAIVETQSGQWNPAKTGTYYMTAQAAGGASVTLKVKIVRPVESMALKQNELTVLIGNEVAQYIPYLVDFTPADATDPTAKLQYKVGESSGTGEVLTQTGDNTITANQTGTASVLIYHGDVNEPLTLSINVVDMPEDADFIIAHKPLVVEVPNSGLKTTNLQQQLLDNINVTEEWITALKQLNSFTLAASTAMVSVDMDAQTVYANEYGTTTLTWTYTQEAAGYDDQGNFTATKQYTYSLGYDLTVTEGLESIAIGELNFGLEDEWAVIRVTTVPENYLLSEEGVEWNIPTVRDEAILYIVERTEGKNEWKVKANSTCTGEKIALSYMGEQIATGSVNIGQRVSYGEGWHWVSFYAGPTSARYFENAQEVRSQSSLTYNDPVFGFFGNLDELTATEAYKLQVKEGSTVDVLIPDQGVYSYTNSTTKDFQPGWTWLGNPYCFNYSLNDVLRNTTLPENSRIISKTAFAAYNGIEWEGTLTSLNAGEGYLVYNAGSAAHVMFPAAEELTPLSDAGVGARHIMDYASVAGETPWRYDSHRFSDNMSIIAESAEPISGTNYSIGAFVGDECRGEGKLIKGKFFITVHGTRGENVTFKLHDNATDTYVNLSERVAFTEMRGTLQSPLTLHSEELTEITDAALSELAAAADVEVYTASGQRVSGDNLVPGVYIVKQRTASGVTSRKVIKK